MAGVQSLRRAACPFLAVLVVFAAAGCESSDPTSVGAGRAKWSFLGIPFRTDGVRAVAVDDGQTFYMANYEGLYISRDKGEMWEKILDVHYWDKWINVIAVHSPSCVYIGTEEGVIHRSLDGGHTWEEIYRSRMYGEIVAVFCDSRGRVFACDTRDEVLLSDDGGESWSMTSMRMYARNFAENPGGDLFVAAHNGVYRLGDDDSTWVGVLTGLPSGTLESMTIVPSGELLLATSQGKIWSFHPGDTTWVVVYANRSGKRFYEIVSDASGNLYALDYEGVVHRYIQASGRWVETDMDVPLYHICTGSQGLILCGGTTTYLSEDGGVRWRAIGMQPVPVSTVAVDMAGRVYAGTFGSGIFRLSEAGAWVLKFNSTYDGVLNVTTIYVRDEMTLYMGSAAEGTALSRDGGDTWWSRFDEGIHVYDFAVDSHGGIYTIFNGYICLIDEQLARWEPIQHDVDYGFVYALETDRAGTIIAGTTRGIFVSEDEAASWRRAGADWIDEPVRTVCATDGGYCFCATESAIWRSNRSYSRWRAVEGIPAPDSTVSISDIPGGCVAIGVYGEGLYVCSEETGAARSITDGLPDLRITGCAADGMDALYVGAESGVYVLDHLEMIVLRLAD